MLAGTWAKARDIVRSTPVSNALKFVPKRRGAVLGLLIPCFGRF